MSQNKSLRVPPYLHSRIKLLASMKEMSIIDFLDDIQRVESKALGLADIKRRAELASKEGEK